MTMTNVNYPHESRRKNSERTKPSWPVIKFYKQIHDSTILSINMSFRAKLPIFSYFSFSLSLFLSQPYSAFSHNFPTYPPSYFKYASNILVLSYEPFTLRERVKDNAKDRSRFSFSFGYSLLFIFASHFFFSLSYFLSFFLVLSLPFSLSVSYSYDIAIVHTAWPLEIVVCVFNYDISTRYLYIYKSDGWITFSRVHDSSFCCIHPEGGEGVSRV